MAIIEHTLGEGYSEHHSGLHWLISALPLAPLSYGLNSPCNSPRLTLYRNSQRLGIPRTAEETICRSRRESSHALDAGNRRRRL